jgi:hypothetical protein
MELDLKVSGEFVVLSENCVIELPRRFYVLDRADVEAIQSRGDSHTKIIAVGRRDEGADIVFTTGSGDVRELKNEKIPMGVVYVDRSGQSLIIHTGNNEWSASASWAIENSKTIVKYSY